MDKIAREIIDEQANKIKARLLDIHHDSTLLGEPFDPKDPNSLLLAAYSLGKQEAEERARKNDQVWGSFNKVGRK